MLKTSASAIAISALISLMSYILLDRLDDFYRVQDQINQERGY